jgi:transcriptional regulator with XRE-family HTH domain
MTGQQFRKIIGENVAFLRDGRGWTQAELVKRAGTSSVAMLETGQRCSLSAMVAVANALGVPLATLCRTDRPDAENLHPEVARFLESGYGGAIKDYELDALISMMTVPGREPTFESCMLALQAIRSMSSK